MMFVYRSRRFIRHVLIPHRAISKSLSTMSSSPSSSSAAQTTPRKLDLMMKQLIGSRRYKDAVDLFEKQSQISTDITTNLALKACTKLNDRERGIRIHQQLSSKSQANPFIQASLLHFYSEWRSSLLLNRCFIVYMMSVLFPVQCGALAQAESLFQRFEKRVFSPTEHCWKVPRLISTRSVMELIVSYRIREKRNARESIRFVREYTSQIEWSGSFNYVQCLCHIERTKEQRHWEGHCSCKCHALFSNTRIS